MKHLKTYESYKFSWESIKEENGELYIKLYELANEMENSVLGQDKNIIKAKEDEYIKLVKDNLEGKVITVDCDDCFKKHTGICEKVEFSGGSYPGGPIPSDLKFDIEYIHIKFEEFDYAHNLGEDLVIVHLNEDPKMYREMKKYNL